MQTAKEKIKRKLNKSLNDNQLESIVRMVESLLDCRGCHWKEAGIIRNRLTEEIMKIDSPILMFREEIKDYVDGKMFDYFQALEDSGIIKTTTKQ
jgi:hypothetical protein